MNVGKIGVVDTTNRNYISFSSLISEMAKYDVIFVGEAHDHAVGHTIENQLLRDLYSVSPNLTASFEMFERDAQAALNSYLAGEISEADFMKNSRPWPNYVSAYRPMIEFSKEQGLPVIAAFIPRRLAMTVGRGGLKAVAENERQWVAKEHYTPEGEYKERFLRTMRNMGRMGKGKMGDKGKSMPAMKNNPMLEAIYRAQCIKDDTAAEAIVNHIAKTGRKVIHYNGSFHSDYHLGTVERVKRLNPALKILVIKIQQVNKDTAPPFENLDMKISDFIVITSR